MENIGKILEEWKPLIIKDWITYEPRAFGAGLLGRQVPMQISFGEYLKNNYKKFGLKSDLFVANGRILMHELDPSGDEFDLLGFSENGFVVFECKSLKGIRKYVDGKAKIEELGITQAKTFISRGFPTYIVHAYDPYEFGKEFYINLAEKITSEVPEVGYVLFSGKDALVIKRVGERVT